MQRVLKLGRPLRALLGLNARGVLPFLLAVLSLSLPTLAMGQKLAGQRVEGTQRICQYRVAETSDTVNEFSIHEQLPCPAEMPQSDAAMPPPPFARLVGSSDNDGLRYCTYQDGVTRWTFHIPLGTACALSVGMLPLSVREQRQRP